MKADVKDRIECFLLISGYTPAFDFFFEDNPDYHPFHIFYP